MKSMKALSSLKSLKITLRRRSHRDLKWRANDSYLKREGLIEMRKHRRDLECKKGQEEGRRRRRRQQRRESRQY